MECKKLRMGIGDWGLGIGGWEGVKAILEAMKEKKTCKFLY